MKFSKAVLALGLCCTTAVFADEGPYIRNVCDSLSSSITIKMGYLDETLWTGSVDLKTATSVEKKHHTDISTIKPFRYMNENVPYSVKASCAENTGNEYSYYSWPKGAKGWSEKVLNNYATIIRGIYGSFQLDGYDSSNTYNFLIYREDDFALDDVYFSGKEIMASRTFELQFDWWYALYGYKAETTTTNENGSTTQISYAWREAVAMDSSTAVLEAKKKLTVPNTVSQVTLQVFHAVYVDESKMSQIVSSSSSEDISTSTSTETDLSSASSEIESSSSEDNNTTVITHLKTSTPVMGTERRMVRRLDGTSVKENEAVAPGIYYVKGENGIWKKQIVFPR